MSGNSVLSKSERARLASIDSYKVLDTHSEQEYDSIARLAAYICRKPIATITFIDAENQFIKSYIGMEGGKLPREDSICQFTILEDQILEINDTFLDLRTSELACVLGEPNIRFYAGIPLITHDGCRIGSLCVIDVVPGKLDEQQMHALTALAQEVVCRLELRKKNLELNDLLHKYEDINTMFNSSAELYCILDRNGTILVINNIVEKMFGYTIEECLHRSIWEFFFEDDTRVLIPILELGLSTGQKNFELEEKIKLKGGGIKWICNETFCTE